MSDISKQDCLHNERTPQCTKIRIDIHNNYGNEQKSPTYSYTS